MIKNPPKNVLLQRSWIWPGEVTSFVSERVNGYSLNVCAGKNPFCDVNLDFDPQDKSIIRGDMRTLPFDAGTFDTVVSDPPWKISYYERMRPFFECVRVCKVGGIIIYNATWVPSSTDAQLLEVYVRQDNVFSQASIISVFRKTQPNPVYEGLIRREQFKNGNDQERLL